MINVEDRFIKNPTMTNPFHSPFLYSVAKRTPTVLLQVYTKFATEVYLSFLYFMSVICRSMPIPPGWSNSCSSATCACFITIPGVKLGAGSTVLRSVRSNFSHESKTLFSPRLLLLRPLLSSSVNRSTVDLAKGHPKRKVKTMLFSDLFAGEESHTQRPHKKKNAGQAEGRKYKSEPSTGIARRKRSAY